MRAQLVAALVACCLLIEPAAAEEKSASQSLEDSHAARAFTDAFMDLVLEERIQDAFDSATAYWSASRAQIGSLVIQTIRQREAVLPTYGEKVGSEFVREDRVGASFLRLTYFEKREQHALVWVFVFYSADGSRWRLNSLQWNDKAVEAF
jgi:hypothetical protein